MSEAPYTVGAWAGMPNYQCSLCPYATLNETEILEHWQARHAAPPPEPLGSSGLVLVADKSGKQVTPAITPAKKRSKRSTMEVHHGETDSDGAIGSSALPGVAGDGELGGLRVDGSGG